MRFVFILLFFSLSFQNLAQKKGWDTTYYKKYRDRIIISYFQSYKKYNIDITQKLVTDSIGKSNLGYISEANLISGLEFNYDKINIQIGFKSPATETNLRTKGKTNFKNLALNIDCVL